MWQAIYIWPDGAWCYEDELEEMSHKSDDYSTQEVPSEFSDNDIEIFVQKFIHANGCPTCEE